MNAVAEVNQGTAVATTGGYDPYAAYGQEAASGGGDFLKFAKVEWQKGQNNDEVALGTRVAANMAELSIGWIRWSEGKPAERRFGLLAEGYKPEPRDALGYTDQTLWETDKDGKPIDPWSFTNELPVADPESGEQMTISMSSKGGIGAMGNLCKAYGREYRQRAGFVPIIELGRDSYIHREYGKLYVPVMTIVDWVENGAVPEPANDGDAGLVNDTAGDVPEKPAEKDEKPKSAGSKTRF